MDIDNEEPNILITFEHEVTLVRIVEDRILPSILKIKTDIFPLVDEMTDDEFNFSITKAKFWLETIVSRCVVFSKNNPTAMKIVLDDEGKPTLNNLLMTSPAEPTDEQMAILFQAKLTALSENKIGYGEFSIKSNNYGDLTFMFIGNHEDILPSHKEWVGDRSYFENSWWDRNDSSTFDVIPSDDADLSKKPTWAYSLDFLNIDANKPAEGDAIIHGFTPTVIDGGKNDDT